MKMVGLALMLRGHMRNDPAIQRDSGSKGSRKDRKARLFAGSLLLAGRGAGGAVDVVHGLNGGEGGHGTRHKRQHDKADEHAAEEFGISRNSCIQDQSPGSSLLPASPAADSMFTARACL